MAQHARKHRQGSPPRKSTARRGRSAFRQEPGWPGESAPQQPPAYREPPEVPETWKETDMKEPFKGISENGLSETEREGFNPDSDDVEDDKH